MSTQKHKVGDIVYTFNYKDNKYTILKGKVLRVQNGPFESVWYDVEGVHAVEGVKPNREQTFIFTSRQQANKVLRIY